MVATPSGLKPDPLSKECVCGGDGRKFRILAPHIFASKVLLVIKHIFQTPFKMVDIQYKTSSPYVDNSTMTYSIDNTWKQGRYIFHLVNHSLVHNGPHFLHVVDHIFTPSQHPTRGWRRPDSHRYCSSLSVSNNQCQLYRQICSHPIVSFLISKPSCVQVQAQMFTV